VKRETIFITGATGLLGSQTLEHLLNGRPDANVFVLVRDLDRWKRVAQERGISTSRVTPLLGDLRRPGLGLSPLVLRRLAPAVTRVLHLAGDIVFSRSLEEARATNVAGTRNLLEVSHSWRSVFCYVSTAFVAGRRTGHISERDLGGQAGWVNAYEQSKWEAEQLVRGSAKDFTILRPSTVVCDSVAGEISQYNAVHHALRLLHSGMAPLIPGHADNLVDVVTADYVATAIARLASRSDLIGETLHLCAGRGSASLGELLDMTFAVWSRDEAWRRRGIAKPALANLATYRLFEGAVEDTGNARLRQVSRSLGHFAPQLATGKVFDTSCAEAALGMKAPPVREYWPRMIEHQSARSPLPALTWAAA